MKKVRDFMNCNVITFSPETSIFEVAKVFSEKNISGAPVVKNGKLVGIISVTDIVKFMSMKLSRAKISQIPSISLLLLNIIQSGKDYLVFKKEMEKISKTEIKHLMSKSVVSIGPEASLYEAASVMEKNDVNRLPVVENNKVIGIVTRTDLIRALIE